MFIDSGTLKAMSLQLQRRAAASTSPVVRAALLAKAENLDREAEQGGKRQLSSSDPAAA